MSTIKEDSEVIVKESGSRGTVMVLDGHGNAIVLFDGGFTGMLALSELKLTGEER